MIICLSRLDKRPLSAGDGGRKVRAGIWPCPCCGKVTRSFSAHCGSKKCKAAPSYERAAVVRSVRMRARRRMLMETNLSMVEIKGDVSRGDRKRIASARRLLLSRAR